MNTYQIQVINPDDLGRMLEEEPEQVILFPSERKSMARLLAIRENVVELRSGKKYISNASLQQIEENLVAVQSPPFSNLDLENAAYWVFETSGMATTLEAYQRFYGFVYPEEDEAEDHLEEVYSFTENDFDVNAETDDDEDAETDTDDDAETDTDDDAETDTDEDAESQYDEDAETEDDEDGNECEPFLCEGCNTVKHKYGGVIGSKKDGVVEVVKLCGRCVKPEYWGEVEIENSPTAPNDDFDEDEPEICDRCGGEFFEYLHDHTCERHSGFFVCKGCDREMTQCGVCEEEQKVEVEERQNELGYTRIFHLHQLS